MTLVWLALSSIIWGALLVGVGTAFQSLTRASGAERQWLWRGLTFLLVLPWLAAPFAALMPRPDFALPEMLPELPAQNVSVTFTAPMGEASVAVPQAALPWPEIVLALVIAGWTWRAFAARRAASALKQILANSRAVVQGPAMAAIRIWSQQLGLKRRPELRVTEASISPFSFGVAKPIICLPDGMEDQLAQSALDLVVGHECLHVARGDGWRRPLERIFADLLWFNPFAWRIRHELDLARELACDEAVLDRAATPGDYARVLRDVAGLASGLDASAPAASMSLSGGGRVLVMRVKRALGHAKRKPGRAALAGMLLLALVGAPMAIAQAVLAAPPAPPAPPSAIAPPAPPAEPGVVTDGIAPPAPVAAPHAPAMLAPPAPLPAPHAGVIAPPMPPAPPTSQERIYVSADGLVRAAFPVRVTSTGGDAAHGYRVDLLQTTKSANGETCSAQIDGLGALRTAAGQSLTRGQPIGERGKLSRFSITATCSDELDGQGRPVRYAPPAPPAPAQPAAPSRAAEPTQPALAAPPAPPAPEAAPTGPTPPAPPAIPARAEVRTPFDARVTKVAMTKELGLYVVVEQIDTPQGFGGSSARGCRIEAPHLSKASVKQGQSVRAGALIGERSNGNGNITAECKAFNVDQIAGPTIPAAGDHSERAVPLVGASKAVLDQPAHLSSPFGFRIDPFTQMKAWHEGVDIAATVGAVVHAPGPGRIAFVGQKDGYENVVELQLPDRMLRFAHLKTLAVKQGDNVTAGAILGTVGMDASSTGPHLHLEMWIDGKSWDPQKVDGLTLIAAN
jgi:murein DD-endopeptidase MepM/ murein hydrolase activator NlpD/beta-lactamase regulating signal transducer with metallopeptidase domain